MELVALVEEATFGRSALDFSLSILARVAVATATAALEGEVAFRDELGFNGEAGIDV